MKKVMLILSIIFAALTFSGAIYVLSTNGSANAGYAVIPMVGALACLNIYQALKKK